MSTQRVVTFNDFKYDDKIADRLKAHIIDLPAETEIISIYAEINETLRNDLDGAAGPLYASIQSKDKRCDPIDPLPQISGGNTLPWDFAPSNNFRNDSEPKVPTLLARNILCDADSPISIFVTFQKDVQTGGFTRGAITVYIKYI